MNVSRLPMEITIRVFDIFYCTNLDSTGVSDIWLGEFGDLRMGERYAVGLIARRRGTQKEIARVGRLAADLIARPSESLRRHYDAVWDASTPSDEFEAMVRQPHSSLLFKDLKPLLLRESPPTPEIVSGLNVVREWCIDKLREHLRARYTKMESEGSEASASPDELFGEDPSIRHAA